MKKLLFFFLALCSCFALQAQNANIVVENPSGTTAVYTTFELAVTGAEKGATVYLPSGTIPASNDYYLRKKLHFFGAGINSAELTAGMTSQLGGTNFYITEAASGSTFEGIKFNTGNLYFQFEKTENSGKGFQLSFTTCELAENTNCSTATWTKEYGCVINLNGCIVNEFYGCAPSYVQSQIFASNCIFTHYNYRSHDIFSASNSIFYNTDGNTSIYIERCKQATLSNCIIRGYIDAADLGSTVLNSIICDRTNSDHDPDVEMINCQDQTWADIFVNETTTFSFGADYHLKEGSLAIGNGTNGSDMGIYGGNTPFTDGIPQNIPVVTEKLVNTRTNNNGELEGTYKVTVK